jgi:hypothetical protein
VTELAPPVRQLERFVPHPVANTLGDSACHVQRGVGKHREELFLPDPGKVTIAANRLNEPARELKERDISSAVPVFAVECLEVINVDD